jgi:hypothetical protein
MVASLAAHHIIADMIQPSFEGRNPVIDGHMKTGCRLPKDPHLHWSPAVPTFEPGHHVDFEQVDDILVRNIECSFVSIPTVIFLVPFYVTNLLPPKDVKYRSPYSTRRGVGKDA